MCGLFTTTLLLLCACVMCVLALSVFLIFITVLTSNMKICFVRVLFCPVLVLHVSARGRRGVAHESSASTSSSLGGIVNERRLQGELMSLMTSADAGISAFPEGDNIFNWVGTIEGSTGTVYEGLNFKLSLKFPSDYPFKSPVVKFETSCFHPNVDNNGDICLDILKEKWSAVYNVRTILLSIQSLLGEPNNDSPLNGYAAALWSNQEEYHKVLHKKYAEASQS